MFGLILGLAFGHGSRRPKGRVPLSYSVAELWKTPSNGNHGHRGSCQFRRLCKRSISRPVGTRPVNSSGGQLLSHRRIDPITAVGLALVAMAQRNAATTERDRAEEQTREARIQAGKGHVLRGNIHPSSSDRVFRCPSCRVRRTGQTPSGRRGCRLPGKTVPLQLPCAKLCWTFKKRGT